MGAPLIGDFSLEGDNLVGEPGVSEGVLARPTVLHGLPCGPGPLFFSTSTLRCMAASRHRLLRLAAAHPDLADAYNDRAAIFAERQRTFDARAAVQLEATRRGEAIELLAVLNGTSLMGGKC